SSRGIIGFGCLEKVDEIGEAGLQLLDHALRRALFDPRLVPVRNLQANEDADDDDGELDSDRDPVLRAQIGDGAAEDHRAPTCREGSPIRLVNSRTDVSRPSAWVSWFATAGRCH